VSRAAWPVDVIEITRDGINERQYSGLAAMAAGALGPGRADARTGNVGRERIVLDGALGREERAAHVNP
jgi:hypothetical protein